MGTRRNLVQKAVQDKKMWGEYHKDRSKYNRGPPNRHAWDEEIEEALNAERGQSDRHSEAE